MDTDKIIMWTAVAVSYTCLVVLVSIKTYKRCKKSKEPQPYNPEDYISAV